MGGLVTHPCVGTKIGLAVTDRGGKVATVGGAAGGERS